MLKGLILFTLFLNLAFAKDRFSEADKKRFIDEVKQGMAEHKLGNKGRVDLQIIKPGFYAELEEYLRLEKFTRDEMLKIKQDYEAFSRSGVAPIRAEEEFYNFVQRELDAINKRPLDKIKEGYICNTWSCEEGFKCAPDPVQGAIGDRKKAGSVCSDNADCASNECVEEKIGSKKKVCEDVYRCFRPLALGQACLLNPVCGTGTCLPFNSLTSGIGECTARGNVCKSNNECCSNLCDGGTCKPNFICKDCVGAGSRPQRGQKCCEGLYMNERGVCAPDVPPAVIPQVRVSPAKTFMVALSSLIISTSYAQENLDTVGGVPPVVTPTTEEASTDPVDPAAAVMKSEIMGNKSKYEAFQAKSEEGKALNMTEKKATLTFDKKSDFNTCEIKFKQDFFNGLKSQGSFDLEVAMLAFDFAVTGDGVSDYWKGGTLPGVSTDAGAGEFHESYVKLLASGDNSIYNRLRLIGLKHKNVRKKMNDQIATVNQRLTCACLDVQGYKKITDATKKKFFEEKCDEYAKYKNPETSIDELDGDASGLKSKRLLVTWTSNLTAFYATMAIDNTAAYKELLAVSNWTNSDAKWNETKTRNYDLFKFNVKNENNSSVAALGAIVGALLAAGAIAILGGFATNSILSTWGAMMILAVSSGTGAGGLWLIASLKGAWITLRPEISDYVVNPRGYSCGKKESCTEYTRTLVQPYNDICKVHTSANACVKNFMVVANGSDNEYIVDPWIPVGVDKTAILSGQPNHAEALEAGFVLARAAMVEKNPGASGGGGKKGGGEFVAESFLSDVFIDATVLGKYANGAVYDMEAAHIMTPAKIKLIKDAAKAFAIKEGFLAEDETANLNSFADYAYEYHIVWPKKSRPGEISYPTVGLSTYLNYMSGNVSGSLATGLANGAKDLSKLNQKYLEDYKKNLMLYSAGSNLDSAKKALLTKEIEKTQKDLDSLIALNSMLANQGLDKQLTNADFLNAQSKIAGANSALLSDSQKNFLKAVGNLRLARKDQLSALDAYNKSMANGDKDRASRVANASKKFSSRFATGNSAMGSGRGSLFAGSSDSSGNADAGKGSGKGFGDMANGSDNDNGINGTGALFGSGSGRSGSGNNYNNSYSGSGTSGGVQGNDRNKIADAIDARNKSSGKYQSNENQTLFEKVTNAYIRNYDKVLTKKKDKDVIEEKQP